MNKYKKNEQGLNFFEIAILAVAGVVLLTAGVTHAWLKNSQVEVIREMDRTQRDISDQEDVINSLQVKIDKKLNIYQLRDDLEKSNSRLVLLPVSAIEKIPGEVRKPSLGAVASADNSDSAFIRRAP